MSDELKRENTRLRRMLYNTVSALEAELEELHQGSFYHEQIAASARRLLASLSPDGIPWPKSTRDAVKASRAVRGKGA